MKTDPNYVPKIEFGPYESHGVLHMIPYIKQPNGKNRIMKGHNTSVTCCHAAILKTPAGQIMVTHSVIH